MTFNELIDIQPKVTLAELIQLFLLGYDDKIYLDIEENGHILFSDIRIIDERLEPYYERSIAYFEDSESCKLTVNLEEETMTPDKIYAEDVINGIRKAMETKVNQEELVEKINAINEGFFMTAEEIVAGLFEAYKSCSRCKYESMSSMDIDSPCFMCKRNPMVVQRLDKFACKEEE